MAITIPNFQGSHPRLTPHLISEGRASFALDCKLVDGSLDSWREPKRIRNVSETTKTVLNKDCCWHEFEECVDVSYGPPTCQNLFITGWKPYPVAAAFDKDCNMTWRRLGVPCAYSSLATLPGAKPTGVNVEKNMESRSYAYQYENLDGVRGDLSPGTRPENLIEGQPVVVSGWEIPDASWGVTKVRIFRTVAGLTDGRETGQELDSTWMFVGETDINAGSFLDTKYNVDLFEALEVDRAFPPPASLKGVVWIEGMNCLAAFSGNRIYFSQNNFYDYWPHWFDLDDNIRGIAESNGTIYIATDGHPYTIQGAVNCDASGLRDIVRLPLSMPMLGWGSRHITPVHSGAVYSSRRGMVFISGTSLPVYLTWPLYSVEKWEALRPETLKPIQFDGKLFVFGKGGSFIMNLPQGPEGGWDHDFHTELSDTDVIDAFVSRQGELTLVKPSGVYLWNKGDKLRPHLWRSGEFSFPRPRSLGAGRLRMVGNETIKVTTDRRTVLDREVLSERVFRIPMWAIGTQWQIELSGTAKVLLVNLGEAMQGL